MSDRYQILGKIGQGGLGAVYKAFDTHLKREVALKRVLTPEQASQADVDQAAEKLMQEATALSTLNHPNIVSVFDVGRDESGGFVVMELLDGETLDDTVERGVLLPKDFEGVVNQTLEALIAAQAKNMLHRDLKPGNIMVNWLPSGKFHIKILDFGLAKISKNPSLQTIDQGDAILGSIYFMAPEQFERRGLTPATDLYAMGCIYYRCLTGRYPFDGEAAALVMASHLLHNVEPLGPLRPDLSSSVADWVMWLMDRDMNKRPQSAREALDRFPAEGAEAVVVAKAVSAPTRPKVLPAPPASARAGAPVVNRPPSGKVPGKVPSGKVPALGAPRPKTGPSPSSPMRVTGRVATKSPTSPLRQTSHVAAAVELEEMEAKKRRNIILGSVAGLALLLFLVFLLTSLTPSAESKERARIAALSNPQAFVGPAEIELLLKYLGPEKTDPQAALILGQLKGNEVNGAILAELKKAVDPATRVNLLALVQTRGITAAFDDVVRIFKTSSTTEERVQAAAALQGIAGKERLNALLALLQDPATPEGPGREALEDVAASVVRMNPDLAKRVEPVIAALSRAKGAPRRSLCRVLGSAGGPTALTLFQNVYNGQDLDYQRAGVLGLAGWPGREPLPLLKKIIETAKDAALKKSAFQAYLQVLAIPPVNPDESAAWTEALALAASPTEKDQVFQVMAARPHPATLAYLKNNPGGATVARTIEQAIAAAPSFRTGGTLPWSSAFVRGQAGGIQKDSAANCLSNWISTESWPEWLFKLEEPGKYEVVLEATYPNSQVSQFELICGGNVINFVNSSTSLNWEKFVMVKLVGQIDITATESGPQILSIRPGKVTQGRLLNIRSVRINKVG